MHFAIRINHALFGVGMHARRAHIVVQTEADAIVDIFQLEPPQPDRCHFTHEKGVAAVNAVLVEVFPMHIELGKVRAERIARLATAWSG